MEYPVYPVTILVMKLKIYMIVNNILKVKCNREHGKLLDLLHTEQV